MHNNSIIILIKAMIILRIWIQFLIPSIVQFLEDIQHLKRKLAMIILIHNRHLTIDCIIAFHSRMKNFLSNITLQFFKKVQLQVSKIDCPFNELYQNNPKKIVGLEFSPECGMPRKDKLIPASNQCGLQPFKQSGVDPKCLEVPWECFSAGN